MWIYTKENECPCLTLFPERRWKYHIPCNVQKVGGVQYPTTVEYCNYRCWLTARTWYLYSLPGTSTCRAECKMMRPKILQPTSCSFVYEACSTKLSTHQKVKQDDATRRGRCRQRRYSNPLLVRHTVMMVSNPLTSEKENYQWINNPRSSRAACCAVVRYSSSRMVQSRFWCYCLYR